MSKSRANNTRTDTHTHAFIHTQGLAGVVHVNRVHTLTCTRTPTNTHRHSWRDGGSQFRPVTHTHMCVYALTCVCTHSHPRHETARVVHVAYTDTRTHTCRHTETHPLLDTVRRVATISRLLKISRISSHLHGSFAKETYNFKEPLTSAKAEVVDLSHVHICPCMHIYTHTYTHLQTQDGGSRVSHVDPLHTHAHNNDLYDKNTRTHTHLQTQNVGSLPCRSLTHIHAQKDRKTDTQTNTLTHTHLQTQDGGSKTSRSRTYTHTLEQRRQPGLWSRHFSRISSYQSRSR